MYLKTVVFIVGGLITYSVPIIAHGQSLNDIPATIFSQCGIASGLLVAAVIYLASSNAKTRAAWEADRTLTAASYEKLAVSNAKLEGIILTLQLQARRGGGEC